MKISVIGHLAKDVFHFARDEPGDERRVESFGGVYYSVATLAHLCSKDDKIYPVFGVAEDQYDGIVECLDRLGNIETKGLFKVKEPVNVVHFFRAPSGARTECSKGISAPIPFSRIKPFLDVDGVLINMASGFDITLETLDLIRMQTREQGTLIHFDFHSLTLGIDDQQKRFRRPLTDWRRWCFMVNSIQLSDEEAATLTAERYDEPTLINQLMPLMVSALLITRGEKGVTLVRQEHKKLFRDDLPGVAVDEPTDTTGCGDVFGAAFLCEYLRTKDYLKAAAFANGAAAVKSSFVGADKLELLKSQLTPESPAG
ncbi:MAG: carbohydrate kinase family protein [Ignavibacteria bacterium]|nr:carbohydrate kinase family protein [Ignavibacteria bacterium]